MPIQLIKEPIQPNSDETLNVIKQQFIEKRIGDVKGYNLGPNYIVPDYTFEKYKEEAILHEGKFENKSVEQLEDEFWATLEEQSSSWYAFHPKYSVDNSFTLFPPESNIWKLGDFNEQQSEIHKVREY